MLSESRKQNPMSPRPVPAPSSAEGLAETRLLVDLARLDWLHSPSPIERLEAVVGRERLSQLLLLIALWPDEEDRLARPFPAKQAA
jgi:hypothetical protein